MPTAAYRSLHPDRNRSCVVFASPHSGRDYPWSFLRARFWTIMRSVRPRMLSWISCSMRAEFGAPFLKAGAPRAYVDLNRAATNWTPP